MTAAVARVATRRAGGLVVAVALVVGMAQVMAQAPVRGIEPLATPAPTAPLRYRLDPTHTFVHWEVLHMGTSTIRGRFDRSVGALIEFDPKAQRLDLGIRIDTASVNSGVAVLDTLLRGDALLASAAHPQAYFTARSARFEGELPREVRGEFTLRGISQPLSLRALRWNCALSLVFKREVCGGDFEAEFDRSSFGITHSLPFVTDRVRLLIQVEAIRAAADD